MVDFAASSVPQSTTEPSICRAQANRCCHAERKRLLLFVAATMLVARQVRMHAAVKARVWSFEWQQQYRGMLDVAGVALLPQQMALHGCRCCRDKINDKAALNKRL